MLSVSVMRNTDSKPLYFARVNSRSDRRVFGIRAKDRFSHVYVIGKTGTGKSTLLETMALQDMEHGNGFALIEQQRPAAITHGTEELR